MMQITGRSLNGAPLFQRGAIKLAVTSRKGARKFRKAREWNQVSIWEFSQPRCVWSCMEFCKNWQEQLRIYTDRIPWPYNRPTKHKCHILRVHSEKLNALSTGLNFHYYCLQPLIYLPLPSSAGRSDSRVGWKWYWVRGDLWCFVLKSAYMNSDQTSTCELRW